MFARLTAKDRYWAIWGSLTDIPTRITRYYDYIVPWVIISIGVESAWLGCAYLRRPTYFALCWPESNGFMALSIVIVGGEALQRAKSLSNRNNMPMNDHKYAWKRSAGLLRRFGTDWENSLLFASEAVVEGVVSSMGVAFDIPIRRCIYMLLIAMIFVWSAVLSFLTRAEVECDAPAVLVPAILDGNTGCAATAVSCCASVFDRLWT